MSLITNSIKRYDTIEEFNMDSKLSIQLNLAHAAETKTNKARVSL